MREDRNRAFLFGHDEKEDRMMTYQVVLTREILMSEDRLESIQLTPETFETEELALEYVFGLLEGCRKRNPDHDIVFRIKGPDGFILEHAAIIVRFKRWFWLKTGRLP
jgi:hypothetical protein